MTEDRHAPGLSPTAARAIEAYGGEGLWRRATNVEATISAGGLAFFLKRRKSLRRMNLAVDLARPLARLQPFLPDGTAAILEGHSVRLEDPAGRVTASREDPRSKFPYGRRTFYWDDLDMAYFAAYAAWNYFALPRLLLRDDIRWSEHRPGTLEAIFPPALPTHSRRQWFHFDGVTGLLRQHDYTAQVFGSWARAAHVVQQHTASAAGVPYLSLAPPHHAARRG